MRNKVEGEKYIAWNPLKGAPSALVLHALHDDFEGFRMLLRGIDRTRMIRLTFESPVSYKNTYETYRAITVGKLFKEGKFQPFMRVTGSKWIESLVEEAGGLLEEEKLKHYIIFSDEDCIEVVTEFPPKAEFLD